MIIYSEIYEAKIVLVEISRETAEELFPNRTIYYSDEQGQIQPRSWHSMVGHRSHVFPESADGRYWIRRMKEIV
jgi:hypothetical protein